MEETENIDELPDELVGSFKSFVQENDTSRMAVNMRKVFFDYLRFQKGNLDTEFDEILNDIETVIDFMESITAYKS
jgi:hypothetical protein